MTLTYKRKNYLWAEERAEPPTKKRITEPKTFIAGNTVDSSHVMPNNLRDEQIATQAHCGTAKKEASSTIDPLREPLTEVEDGILRVKGTTVAKATVSKDSIFYDVPHPQLEIPDAAVFGLAATESWHEKITTLVILLDNKTSYKSGVTLRINNQIRSTRDVITTLKKGLDETISRVTEIQTSMEKRFIPLEDSIAILKYCQMYVAVEGGAFEDKISERSEGKTSERSESKIFERLRYEIMIRAATMLKVSMVPIAQIGQHILNLKDDRDLDKLLLNLDINAGQKALKILDDKRDLVRNKLEKIKQVLQEVRAKTHDDWAMLEDSYWKLNPPRLRRRYGCRPRPTFNETYDQRQQILKIEKDIETLLDDAKGKNLEEEQAQKKQYMDLLQRLKEHLS